MDDYNVPNNPTQIAKNTFYLYVRMIVVTLVTLYVSRVVLRMLGEEDFGIYSIVGSIVVFFSFIRSALNAATTRFLSFEIGKGDNNSIRNVFSMAINFHIILAICLAIVTEIVGYWFINNHLNIDPSRLHATLIAFQFALLTFCISIVQAPFDANIIAHERMDFYALICIADVIGKLAIAFLLIISPIDRLIFYSMLLSAAALLVFLGYVLYNHHAFKEECSYHLFWDKHFFTRFASYSGWNILVNFSDVTTIQCRAIFFNLFLGVIANAALGLANQVFNAMSTLLSNFINAFTPQIYKSYAQEDKAYFMHLIFSSSKLSYYLYLLAFIPLVINLPFILKIWLGEYPAMTAQYTIALLTFLLFDSFQAPLWNAIYATGNIRNHQIVMSSIKLCTIPLMWFVLYLGDHGIAAILVWTIGNILCSIARVIIAKKQIELDIKHYLKDVIGSILLVSILSAPAPALIVYFMGQGWLTLCISVPISILITATVCFYIGLTSRERNIIFTLPIISHFHKQP